jgi:hypothetical protein
MGEKKLKSIEENEGEAQGQFRLMPFQKRGQAGPYQDFPFAWSLRGDA